MDCSLLLIAAFWVAAAQKHSPSAAAKAAAQACSLLLTAAVWAAAHSPSAAAQNNAAHRLHTDFPSPSSPSFGSGGFESREDSPALGFGAAVAARVSALRPGHRRRRR